VVKILLFFTRRLPSDLLTNLGVKALDALHIASAVRAGATVLLTTDDALKNIMKHHSDIISIRIMNPAAWYEEVTGNESEDTA